MTQTYFLRPFPLLINLFTLTFFSLHPKPASCINPSYLACTYPRTKTCGDGQKISFPFYIQDKQDSFCGFPGFHLSCNSKGKPILNLGNSDYIVQHINYNNQSIRVSNAAVLDTSSTSCLPPIQNISLPDYRFNLATNQTGLFLLYNCNSTSDVPPKYKVNCSEDSVTASTLAVLEHDHLLDNVSRKCENVVEVPLDTDGVEGSAQGVKGSLERGFLLNWVASNCSICETSGGKCGFDNTTYHFKCFCPDRPHARQCVPGERNLGLKLGLGFGICFPSITALVLLLLYVFRHHNKRKRTSSKLILTSSSFKENLEESSVYFGVPVFSFSELEEATSNFSSEKELGDGGFGTVYYGKLRDGREVAVKRLYGHNLKRFEQFMNEVQILTRLRHRNLVSLYGCTSRHSKELLLVYEYIPNGTVADHLHGDQAKSSPLTWDVRMSIAIETASALTYLHASDTIHRDVKTNNLLLDNNFCVKVADFGLSRLFPIDATHVSTAPQGTPGYVDPEYYQCYQLTGKSDVYSFGVVLIELISSTPAVDITRHRSEINLANLAINKIRKCAYEELVDPCLGYKTDKEIKRMTISVAELAFLCLQQEKDMRPTMVDVMKELIKIQSGDSEKNLEEVHDTKNKELNNALPHPSPQECDEDYLLKNIHPPPSPISVTDKLVSISTSISDVSG